MEIEDIAASLDEPVPREVYLIGPVNAFVADRGGLLGLGNRRMLAIGLPLLSLLTVSEFRGVLAHEFAHYYSGDTRMGPWVYRTQSAMIRSFQNIGSLREVGRIGILQLRRVSIAQRIGRRKDRTGRVEGEVQGAGSHRSAALLAGG